jgi:hypothetical protein
MVAFRGDGVRPTYRYPTGKMLAADPKASVLSRLLRRVFPARNVERALVEVDARRNH